MSQRSQNQRVGIQNESFIDEIEDVQEFRASNISQTMRLSDNISFSKENSMRPKLEK